MTPFEEELKRALTRREPPDGFAARVLARAAEQQKQSGRWSPRAWLEQVHLRRLGHLPLWRLMPAFVVLLAVMAGAVFQRHQRMVRGEEAKEKLLIAMRIAGTKLHDAQRHVIDLQGTEVK